MTIDARPATARRWRIVRLALLAAASLMMGHEAVYAVRYGLGAALAEQMTARGHDGYWLPFLCLSLAATGVLGGAVTIRQRRLAHRLGALGQRGERADPGVTMAGEWRAITSRLLPVLLLLFLLQENVEQILATGVLAGLDPFLAADALLSLPVLLLVGSVAAAAGALVRWREATLRARIAAAEGRRRRPALAQTAPRRWMLIADACRHRWILGRPLSGPAPPWPASA